MNKVSKLTFLSAFLLVFSLILPAAANALPSKADHEKFVKNNEYYGDQYKLLQSVYKEVREKMGSDAEKVISEANKALEATAAADIKEGAQPDDAWAGAYDMTAVNLQNELAHDYLRRNAKGIQGFYRGSTKDVDSWLTIEEGEDAKTFAVKMSVRQLTGDKGQADLDGFGKLEGKKLIAFDKNNDECPIEIMIEGEKATVKESEKFKKSDFLGTLTTDGTYTREKK